MTLLTLFACSTISFPLHDAAGHARGGGGGTVDTADTGTPEDTDTDNDPPHAPFIYGEQTVVPTTYDWTSWLRLSDVNGDGRLDMVYTGSLLGGWMSMQNEFALSVALQAEDGSFVTTDTVMPHLGGYRQPFELGDLDGDGDDDFVSAHADGMTVLLNDGAGAFGSPMELAGVAVGSIALADRDGDGDLDIVALADEMEVYDNDGTGAFTLVDQWPVLGWSGTGDSDGSQLTLADVDGDGVSDVVAVFEAAACWLVYRGDGAGGFTHTVAASAHQPRESTPYSLEVGDVTGDGVADALGSMRDSSFSSVSWDGSVLANPVVHGTELYGPTYFHIADVDGDGDNDVLTSDAIVVELLLQEGGSLVSQGAYTMAAGAMVRTAADSAALGDIDGDGCEDIVMAIYPSGIGILPYGCGSTGS